MSRTLIIGVWLAIVMGVALGTHYYLWVRLVRDTLLPSPWSQIATTLVVALGVSLPTAMVLGRALDAKTIQPLPWLAFGWMGVMFLAILLLGGADLLRLMGIAVSRLDVLETNISDPERRLFFSRMLGGGVAMTAFGMGAVGVQSAIRGAKVRPVRVFLKRLPKSMSGFVIVQISDLHVGPTIGREDVESLVAKTNALKPDLVAITGDLVDGSVDTLGAAVAPLKDLESRYGTFFVTGNHEYYSGVRPWEHYLRSLGIRVLRNEHVPIGNAEEGFDLAGVDDTTAHRYEPDHGEDVAQAVQGHSPDREIVLLAHQPKAIHEAAKHGVGLQLSGHTHGGQIFPFSFVVGLVQPYVAGLHQHSETTQIYVSRGTGYWGPPMRLAAPSELTRIELISSLEV